MQAENRSERTWRFLGLLCAGWLLLLAAGCGNSAESEPAVEPVQIPVTSAAPLSATELLTAEELRTQLGASDEARFERAGTRFTAADLTSSGAKTLDPLQGQPLKFLSIARTSISDLSPVKGMPLEQVILAESKVADLGPLAGAPVTLLDASSCPVKDLQVVTSLPRLAELYLEKAEVSDLTPLQHVSLSKLWINFCPISDLGPLKGKSLEELNLCNTPIESLEPLAGMTLGTLWVRETPVSDLAPLAGMSLVSLDLQGTKVVDLSPLSKMTSLQRLNIADCPVADLTPLAGLNLNRLIFTPEKIKEGMQAIRGMSSLQALDTSFEGVSTPLTPEEFWTRYDKGEFQKSESPEAP